MTIAQLHYFDLAWKSTTNPSNGVWVNAAV